ncbi:uncharacterized protein LOC132705860 [Cylas formicarius]|uniref:uncharacterized protein LOC132705860 n=1 Tax=Cylas formicarius TaxID=197179 RepID=UPI0029584584|nr:uncharacterized protein LOC132705860 [Cylas formicarius]
MRIIPPLKQIVNAQTLDALRKSISKTVAEATPYINAAKKKQIDILNDKFFKLNNWYMRVVGLDKVQLSQDRVTALQQQLLDVQEKRREVSRQLTDVRNKSMEMQDEIHKIKRQDDLEKFLDLMKKETEILKLEKTISRTFQDYDQTERELFTAFTNAIRDTHEKQRAQMEYTKYLGIILSLIGSLLAFLFSTIRKQQLKALLDERLSGVASPLDEVVKTRETIDQVINSLHRLEQGEVISNKSTFEEVVKTREVINEVVNSLHRLEGKETALIPHTSLVEDWKTHPLYVKIFAGAILVWLFLKAV